jgi:hypothetical protein
MEETVTAFEAAFALLGYSRCESGGREAGVEKIAIYTLNGKPTHAARQLQDGFWASKLGREEDVEHSTPERLVSYPGCSIYGKVEMFMQRRRS